MKKIIFITFIILLAVTILTTTISLINKESPIAKSPPSEETELVDNNLENEESPENDYLQETTNIQNENGGAGSSSGESQSSQAQQCEKQISYALKNFNTLEECLSEQDGVCLIKEVTCSLDIKNLDYETSGEFVIKFEFLDQSGVLLFSTTSSVYVNARETKNLQAQNQFEDENADKNFMCSFKTESVPEENIC